MKVERDSENYFKHLMHDFYDVSSARGRRVFFSSPGSSDVSAQSQNFSPHAYV